MSHLVANNSDFAVEWTSIIRSVGMREGPTMHKIELVLPQLEAEIAHKAQEEVTYRAPATDRQGGYNRMEQWDDPWDEGSHEWDEVQECYVYPGNPYQKGKKEGPKGNNKGKFPGKKGNNKGTGK